MLFHKAEEVSVKVWDSLFRMPTVICSVIQGVHVGHGHRGSSGNDRADHSQ